MKNSLWVRFNRWLDDAVHGDEWLQPVRSFEANEPGGGLRLPRMVAFVSLIERYLVRPHIPGQARTNHGTVQRWRQS